MMNNIYFNVISMYAREQYNSKVNHYKYSDVSYYKHICKNLIILATRASL